MNNEHRPANSPEWFKLLGRFHGSEVADARTDPNYKVVKLDVKAEPFPGAPPEDFADQTLYELYEWGGADR
tara:strand:+ start:1335 stop:1547 length:213 start_codon:yes stop_codon:yes gene_type:complete